MRKILLSLSVIGIVALVVIGATVAYFHDVETSTGNTMAAGTLDLKIRDQDEGYKNGVVGTWKAEDAKPGDEWKFDVPFVGFFNDGTIKGDHLEITCDYSVIEESPQTESDTQPDTNLHPEKMAKEMIITKSIYRGTEDGKSFCINALNGKKYTSFNAVKRYCFGTILATSTDWQIEDKDGDGKITFYDLKNDKLDNLPAPDEETFYIMDVKFAETAGNDFQGDTFDLTMIFTLNQDVSQ
ncbi:MAG: TasA family protein [candidate division WOR-3 bacterium]